MVTTIFGSVVFVLLLNMCMTATATYMICSRSKIHLLATREKQIFVSSEYEAVGNESVYCMWEINAKNASDVIQFKVVHWFAPPTSDCSKDYLVLADDAGMWTRPLQAWCKDSKTDLNVVLKTRTATLAIEFYSAIFWQERVVFSIEYWTAPDDITVVNPAEFGAANYVLLVASGILGAVFVGAVVAIVYKECSRARAVKVLSWRQKLMIRRKGISGEAIRRKDSLESMGQSDATSYIQLTETPTSIRCSSAWTPSPVTQISVSGTPTSGNFSL